MLFKRGRIRAAALLLIVYSTSGLVGVGHYTVPGMVDQPVWRQLHVLADIALGACIFAFAVWAAVARRTSPAARG